jgi:hypothetical protein
MWGLLIGVAGYARLPANCPDELANELANELAGPTGGLLHRATYDDAVPSDFRE